MMIFSGTFIYYLSSDIRQRVPVPLDRRSDEPFDDDANDLHHKHSHGVVVLRTSPPF